MSLTNRCAEPLAAIVWSRALSAGGRLAKIPSAWPSSLTRSCSRMKAARSDFCCSCSSLGVEGEASGYPPVSTRLSEARKYSKDA